MLQRPNPLANQRRQAAANKIFVSLPAIRAQAKFVQAIPMTGMAGYAGTGQREPSCQWAWRRPACTDQERGKSSATTSGPDRASEFRSRQKVGCMLALVFAPVTVFLDLLEKLS